MRYYPPLRFIACLAASVLVGRAAANPGAHSVHPSKIHLNDRSRSQQIAVGFEADGAAEDRTRDCQYAVADPKVAVVSADGKVTALADGRTTLKIESASGRMEVPIEVQGIEAPRRFSYREDVAPILSKAGCNQGTCHGSLTGKGGFRLSLRGDDPAFDREMITREALGRRVDLIEPGRSLLLQKGLGLVPHEGGRRLEADSEEYAALRSWIASGAQDDGGRVSEAVGLEIHPPHRVLRAGQTGQQLVVTAVYADGGRRDVTRLSCYETDLPSGVQVSSSGLVQVDGPLEVVVSVRFNQARAVCRLIFLPDRPSFQWQDQPVANFIDECVNRKLETLRIQPSEIVDDATFLRRAYLTTIGVLPTADEARAFLSSKDENKRAALADELVQRSEFADYWALKWADVLRNEQKSLGVKGVWSFRRWLVRQIDRDAPFDEVASEILSSVGATYHNPAAGFYRTNREPDVAAEAVAQVFLGYRLQCAKCHNHPFDVWKQDDYYGLAAYFSSLQRKKMTNIRRDRFDKHEVNGDEVVYFSGKAQIRQPVRGVMMSPQPLTDQPRDMDATQQPLQSLADWVTSERQFHRNVANRVWYHLMGRGIVDAPDDFRISNPPSNPELLEALTDHFIDSGSGLKPLVATILKSQTFQRSAVPNDSNADDDRNFSRYPVRLMSAEVLLDALSQFLEASESFPDAPAGMRAVQLPGAQPNHPFLKAFGKPQRLITCECERSSETTLSQAFQLINGELVREKLRKSDNRLGRLLKENISPESMVTQLYLSSLGRRPSERELQAAVEHLKSAESRRDAVEDVAWALLNSKEFLLIH